MLRNQQHNALGAQTVETDPAATAQRFFYDNRGLLTLHMNARGNSIIMTYDEMYRPASSTTIMRSACWLGFGRDQGPHRSVTTSGTRGRARHT
ncbi:MAG: hypothetical protein ACT4R6_06820 [Gemmatimonadaceae bacterium]